MRLPWWLSPWREARRAQNLLADRIRGSAIVEGALRESLAQMTDRTREAERESASLRGQLAAAVTDSVTSGSALSTASPEFVLVGIPRGPGMGKRLMASRDLTVTAFAMTEYSDPPPRWKLGAILERLLVIDKPTYGEALAHMATIWANWDKDAPWSRPDARPLEDIQAIETADRERTSQPFASGGIIAVDRSGNYPPEQITQKED